MIRQGVGWELTVYGEPKSKERPRHTKGGHTYTPKATVEAEEALAWQWKRRSLTPPPLQGACGIELRFYTRRVTKDLDNMVKLVLDALNGVAYADDRQIRRIIAEKHVATSASTARTEIWLYAVNES